MSYNPIQVTFDGFSLITVSSADSSIGDTFSLFIFQTGTEYGWYITVTFVSK